MRLMSPLMSQRVNLDLIPIGLTGMNASSGFWTRSIRACSVQPEKRHRNLRREWYQSAIKRDLKELRDNHVIKTYQEGREFYFARY